MLRSPPRDEIGGRFRAWSYSNTTIEEAAGYKAPKTSLWKWQLRQILIDGLQVLVKVVFLKEKFDLDGMDVKEDALSATVLETLLRSSVAAGKYLEEAGHRVAAIIPSASVKTEASFMTIDTIARYVGSAIPSVKAWHVCR